MKRALRRAAGAVCALLILTLTGLAHAEEKKETGGMVRHSIMVPLVDKKTNSILKTVPVIVEINSTTAEAKNFFTDRMPILQDAYMQATYGKVYTDVSEGVLSKALEDAVNSVAGEEYKDQYSITIRVNVRPK